MNVLQKFLCEFPVQDREKNSCFAKEKLFKQKYLIYKTWNGVHTSEVNTHLLYNHQKVSYQFVASLLPLSWGDETWNDLPFQNIL